MLIAKNWHGPPALPEDIHDAHEELVARIFRLPHLILWIVAVLSNQHHAVNRELIAAKRESFGNCRIDLHRRMPGGAFPAEIVGADLVDVQRYQIHLRTVVRTVPAIPIEKPVNDVLGMGVLEELSRDAG